MKHSYLIFSILMLLCLGLVVACGSSSDGSFADGADLSPDEGAASADDEGTSDPDGDLVDPSDPDSDSSGGKVWTVAEILSEPRTGGSGGTPLCGGELGFKRCTCAEDVPSSVRYRPAVAECNGNAAAIFHDQYLDIFSVVVRDSQNRDRWPEAGSGFGGCSAALANSESPPNRCSAFKVQDKFTAGDAMVHCFGASGYSQLFADAQRLTVKLEDSPNSSDDPLERFCLYSGDRPLN